MMPNRLQRLSQGTAALVLGLSLSLAGVLLPSPVAQSQSSRQFYCAKLHGQWNTFLRNSRGQFRLITWTSDRLRYNPRERCMMVSQRFQSFYNRGLLTTIRTGVINGYPVLCVPNDCREVLVTLEVGADRGSLRQRLEDMVRGARYDRPIRLEGLVTYDPYEPGKEQETYLDMNGFLDLLEE